MTDLNDSPEASDVERKRIQRSRNRVVAVILIGFAVLIYMISIAKMT